MGSGNEVASEKQPRLPPNGHESEQTLGDGEKDREAWHAAVHGVAKNRT